MHINDQNFKMFEFKHLDCKVKFHMVCAKEKYQELHEDLDSCKDVVFRYCDKHFVVPQAEPVEVEEVESSDHEDENLSLGDAMQQERQQTEKSAASTPTPTPGVAEREIEIGDPRPVGCSGKHS
jgi:hypothetical protein